ncbi:hypothetical protein [Thalassotalea aquiviva]|uniref:hypothetical protein n=1 Tax=Thalassotalea aquiviva TaxID=3242415 RepID=UPI00352B9C3F
MHTRVVTTLLLLAFMVLLASGCTTTEVKTTEVTPLKYETNTIPEEELLDVGINIFDPGLDQINQEDSEVPVFSEIRIAESSYFPYLLMETIQSTGAWGAVRVIPEGHSSVDVIVDGTIIKSDGETLEISIAVRDSKNRAWFSKTYQNKASHYAYSSRSQVSNEPFQNIYNQIANDILAYKSALNSASIRELRKVSELKFASAFAEQQFSSYLKQNDAGELTINRLPADNEPMMQRIKQIRERDYLFIDTLQEYYGSYAKEMQPPYKLWRKESYNEVVSLRNMQRTATNQKLLGAAAIIAGILGAGNSNGSVRAASMIGVTAGGYLIKDGMERSEEALIHAEALQELGDSFEASIESQVIELEDRTVTLTGTVENQYMQWRDILKDIYQINNGE